MKCTSFPSRNGFEPIQHGGVEANPGHALQCSVPLPGDDVRDPVMIHIGNSDRVQLRERHTVLVLFRLLAHDQMFFELNLSLVVLAEVFEPRETIRMGRFAGNDVVPAVAVHIEREHLRTAAVAELHRVELPEFILPNPSPAVPTTFVLL